MTRPRTASVVDYGQGLRGRVCDLPGHYQDAYAEALLTAHPHQILRRALAYQLTSDRFRRSRHQLLRDVTPEQALLQFREEGRSYRHRVRLARAEAGITRASHLISRFKTFKAVTRVIQSQSQSRTKT